MATEKKLDIFYVIEQIDRRNFNYYSTLTDDEKKSISMWLMMRWTSLVSGSAAEDYMLNTNDVVNYNFGDLTSHPELQWKLLCLVGNGKKQRHVFVKPPRGKTKNKKQAALLQLNPLLKSDELEFLESIISNDDLKQDLMDAGWLDKEIKEVFSGK
jgi:hypothetical protein